MDSLKCQYAASKATSVPASAFAVKGSREDAGKDESVQRGTSEKHRVERRERAVEVCLYRRDFVGGEECHLDFLSVSKKDQNRIS